jgi:hypothetical protein
LTNCSSFYALPLYSPRLDCIHLLLKFTLRSRLLLPSCFTFPLMSSSSMRLPKSTPRMTPWKPGTSVDRSFDAEPFRSRYPPACQPPARALSNAAIIDLE